MIKPLDYVDGHNAITQHPKFGGDEGDSAHREAFYFLGIRLANIQPVKPMNLMSFFPALDGYLVRHRQAKRQWIRQYDRGSRDQYTPWICYLTYDDSNMSKLLLRRIGRLLWKRRGLFTNTKKNGVLDTPDKTPDLITPKLLAILLRGRWGVWSYALNWLLDIHTLLATIHWRFRDPKDNDVCNHLAILATAREVYPTPWIWLSWMVLDKADFRKRLKEYWDWPGYAKAGENYKDAYFVAEPWIVYLHLEKNTK